MRMIMEVTKMAKYKKFKTGQDLGKKTKLPKTGGSGQRYIEPKTIKPDTKDRHPKYKGWAGKLDKMTPKEK